MKFQLGLLLLGLSQASSYKILVLVPFTGASHFMMMKVMMQELLRRGHEVTSISAFPFGKSVENYTEILIDPPWNPGTIFSQERIFNMDFGDHIESLRNYFWLGISSTTHCLENQAVKDFIINDDTKFDLILSEQFFQEALLMFSHKYKAPIVTLSTNGYSDFVDRIMGAITPYSFVPHMILSDYGDNMTFLQRTYNFIFSLADVVIREFYYLPTMNDLAQKHFEHLGKNLPAIQELEKSVSIILVNNHVALFKPRPLMPGIIDIGGSHIKKPKPLPEKIKKFLDGAENGVIYMSLGSYVQSSSMPKEKLKIILRVFGSLKQRVLWKYEKDDIENFPANVMVGKWMPQADILNHPNVILFISHGGLFGTMEGSYYGKPILFIPFIGDQYRNAKMAGMQGYGRGVLFNELTEDLFKSKISEMLENKSYLVKAKEVSRFFKDNVVHPMETAMFWMEFVARNKGAKHLKSHAVNIPFYQYLMLDVIAFMLLVLWAVYRAVRLLLARIVKIKNLKTKLN